MAFRREQNTNGPDDRYDEHVGQDTGGQIVNDDTRVAELKGQAKCLAFTGTQASSRYSRIELLAQATLVDPR